MQFTSSLFLIAHMAAGALALSGDGAACSDKYVCWGQRRKGDWCNVNYSGTVCNNGLKCVSHQGSWFLGKCT
ncbi:uncharacterized protein FFMR_12592 [Fusarium fujikuroi]|nr:uncharacterized protein FFMR_12592 [Fusarium fujikuroi]